MTIAEIKNMMNFTLFYIFGWKLEGIFIFRKSLSTVLMMILTNLHKFNKHLPLELKSSSIFEDDGYLTNYFFKNNFYLLHFIPGTVQNG